MLMLAILGHAGKTTVNSVYGTRVAVLAGDFLFAQSSWFLANLDNLEVCIQTTQGSFMVKQLDVRCTVKVWILSCLWLTLSILCVGLSCSCRRRCLFIIREEDRVPWDLMSSH